MIAAIATRVRAGFSSDYQYGVAITLFSAIAWSSTGLFIRIIPEDAWTQLVWRGFFGGLTALAFVVARDKGRSWRMLRSFGVSFWVFTACNTAGMVMYITALKITTVAHVTIIYSTMPLAAALLSWLILERDDFSQTRIGIPKLSQIRFNMQAGIGGQHAWRDRFPQIYASGLLPLS